MFIADVGGGAMSAVIAILAALVGRERFGVGATLDVSMHDAALYWVMLPAARELIDGGAAATGELPTFGEHACYNIYETRDGRQIALGALERKFWVAFCEGIGRPDLAARHETGGDDQAALVRDMRALFKTRTRDEWLSLFAGHEVCLTPVNSPAEALRDPHIIARGTVTTHAGLRAVRPPFMQQVPDLAPHRPSARTPLRSSDRDDFGLDPPRRHAAPRHGDCPRRPVRPNAGARAVARGVGQVCPAHAQTGRDSRVAPVAHLRLRRHVPR